MPGYSIEGKVLGTDQKPQNGLDFELFGTTGDGKVIAKVVSDENGRILFQKIPVGQYIIALSNALADSLQLVVNEQPVDVYHDHVKIEDFVVKSFSVHGKVKAGLKPLKGVKVQVDAHGKTLDLTSDKDGSFVLKDISSPPLVFKAVLEGYDFDVVTVNKLGTWSMFSFHKL